MTISQTTITGSIKRPDNTDAAITEVTFTLKSMDFEDGECIARNSVAAEVDTRNGDFMIVVWPNDAGLKGNTTYDVSFKFSDGTTIDALRDVYVRSSSDSQTLEDVVAQAGIGKAIAPYALKLLSRAAFDALPTAEPNTLYLVRG